MTDWLQLSYSSFIKQRGQYIPKTWEQADPKGVAVIALCFHFYTPRLLLLVLRCAEQGLYPPPVRKGNANRHMLKGDWRRQWQPTPVLLLGESHTVHGVAKSWTRLSDFTFMHWRRKWQPTPVFLPGESQGQRSLLGCCLWGRTESDTTDAT